ncbi:hypothetical protein E2C01_004991 [Portunus trituberculatus]|uniref:Uncharacterized protein n=1 Tax=Portunus trituberculatus TaxID=210409 RepID=A0A5B7CR77_PORTR|nr:hypothetical protein [Portunus trituberculatus]
MMGLGLPPPPTTELSRVSRSARRFFIFSLNLSLLLLTLWILAHVSSPIVLTPDTKNTTTQQHYLRTPHARHDRGELYSHTRILPVLLLYLLTHARSCSVIPSCIRSTPPRSAPRLPRLQKRHFNPFSSMSCFNIYFAYYLVI